MKFCTRCGGILVPDKNKKRFVCGSCGKASDEIGSIMIREEVRDKREKVEVIDKDIEVNPKVDIECPKCGNMKAYFWMLQTRAADESETRFYECCKCHHRWRAYD